MNPRDVSDAPPVGHAAAVTAEQVRIARSICLAEGLPPTADVLSRMVQALAVNGLAETLRGQ